MTHMQYIMIFEKIWLTFIWVFGLFLLFKVHVPKTK